jgi:hypothetical protein
VVGLLEQLVESLESGAKPFDLLGALALGPDSLVHHDLVGRTGTIVVADVHPLLTLPQPEGLEEGDAALELGLLPDGLGQRDRTITELHRGGGIGTRDCGAQAHQLVDSGVEGRERLVEGELGLLVLLPAGGGHQARAHLGDTTLNLLGTTQTAGDGQGLGHGGSSLKDWM